eukprot:scaffold3330_cov128-Isochrysis_galbana.AAC.6
MVCASIRPFRGLCFDPSFSWFVLGSVLFVVCAWFRPFRGLCLDPSVSWFALGSVRFVVCASIRPFRGLCLDPSVSCWPTPRAGAPARLAWSRGRPSHMCRRSDQVYDRGEVGRAAASRRLSGAPTPATPPPHRPPHQR